MVEDAGFLMTAWRGMRSFVLRLKRAGEAFRAAEPREQWVRGLHLVPNVLPDLPPGCSFAREECGWSVVGRDGEAITTDLDPEDGARIAWNVYNAFDHEIKSAG